MSASSKSASTNIALESERIALSEGTASITKNNEQVPENIREKEEDNAIGAESLSGDYFDAEELMKQASEQLKHKEEITEDGGELEMQELSTKTTQSEITPFYFASISKSDDEIKQNIPINESSGSSTAALDDSLWEEIPLEEYLEIVGPDYIAEQVTAEEDVVEDNDGASSESSGSAATRILFSIFMRFVYVLACLLGEINVVDLFRAMNDDGDSNAETDDAGRSSMGMRSMPDDCSCCVEIPNQPKSFDSASYNTAIDMVAESGQSISNYTYENDGTRTLPPPEDSNNNNNNNNNGKDQRASFKSGQHPIPLPNSTVDFIALIFSCAMILIMLGTYATFNLLSK